MRPLSTCSSASFIIPVSPSRSRSLYSLGSYNPSASASSTRKRAHSSSSWCQSLQDRAALDRLAALAQVVVDDHDLAAGPAQQDGPLGQGVLAGGRLLMIGHLLGGGLADVDDRRAIQVPGLELGRGERFKR